MIIAEPQTETVTQTQKKRRFIEQIAVDLLDPLEGARPLDHDNVENLAESIGNHGLLQPIAVIRNVDRYLIAFGNHRAAAHELLNKKMIHAEVWPEGTSMKEMHIRSLHENHCRQDESLQSTLDRLNGLMLEHDCTMNQATKIAKIQKGTASKINCVIKNLSDEAMQCIRDHKIGISAAYEVARRAPDAATQVKWLSAHASGQMSRDAIIQAAKGKPKNSTKKVKLDVVVDGIIIRLVMPHECSYDQLYSTLANLRSKLVAQCKRNTPVDLLPRLMNQGGAV